MCGKFKRFIFIPVLLLAFIISFGVSFMPVAQAGEGLPEPEFIRVEAMNALEKTLEGTHSSLKYSSANDGVKSKDGKTVEVWFTKGADDLINVRFTSDFPVSMVYVKNNAGGNLYTFNEAVDAASGLIAPNTQNTNSEKNHVTFYFSNSPDNPEPPTVVYKALKPVLEFVQDNGDDTYTAHWGYMNENDTIVDAKASYFTGNRSGGTTEPPIEDFEPGRVIDAFQTVFDGTNLVWTLTGPDGSTRTATASAQNARPYEPPVVEYKPLKPVLEYVQTNADGLFTAHWGYMNENDTIVDAKASYFTGNRSGGTTEPPIVDFEPGRIRDVFQTVFDGTNLVWTLTGPDGSTRTATASGKNARPYEPPEDPGDDDNPGENDNPGDNNNPPPTNNDNPGQQDENTAPSDTSGHINQPSDEGIEDTSADAGVQDEESDEITLDDEAVPEGSLPKTGGLPPMLFYSFGMGLVALGFKLRKRD